MNAKEKRILKSAARNLEQLAEAMHYNQKTEKKPEEIIGDYAKVLARLSQ